MPPSERSRTRAENRCWEAAAAGWHVAGPGSGRISVQALPQVVGDQVDADAARPAVQVAEDALAVTEGAKHGLVLGGLLEAEQRKDAGNLVLLGRPEREHAGNAVRDLFVEQVTGVLRDHDQRGVA